MLTRNEFAAELAAMPLIGILRHLRPEHALPVCRLLAECGFRLLEIPLNSPEALRSIAQVAALAPRPFRIGAGTVLTPDQVEAVAAAGGEFIIAPDCNPEVIRAAVELGLIAIPGFLTPTEAFTAIRAGADYLKCFPAGRLGTAYLRDLQAVIDTPILAVGGIGVDNLDEWLGAAAGIGVGSALFRPEYSQEEIGRHARALIRAARP